MEEVPTRMEPCHLDDRVPPAVTALALEIGEGARRLSDMIPAYLRPALRATVAASSAVYSSLIEKRPLHPLSLESPRASAPFDMEGRALLGAELALDSAVDVRPATVGFVSSIHRAVYGVLAKPLRMAGDDEIVPGAFRDDPSKTVAVGRHFPPSADRVAAFMEHWERRYGGAGGRLVSIPAAHHRLSFIHPFPDGNGRTARLVTHAMCRAAGVSADGLWSVSRALGRDGGAEYLSMMDQADTPRQGALDGRGNLSLRALERFTEWMLGSFASEIGESAALFDPAALAGRYATLVARSGSDGYSHAEAFFLSGGDPSTVGQEMLERLTALRMAVLLPDGKSHSVGLPLFSRQALFPGYFPQ